MASPPMKGITFTRQWFVHQTRANLWIVLEAMMQTRLAVLRQ